MAFLSSTSTLKRKRLYYTAEDDLILLREVVGHNPFEDGGRWNIIEKNVQDSTGKPFKKRSLQDRVSNLTEKFQKKLEEDQFKSGTEEYVTELDDLLNSIIQLMHDFKKVKPPKTTPYQIGYERRETAADLVSSNIFENAQEDPNLIMVIDDIENPNDYNNNEENTEEGHDVSEKNKEEGHDTNNKSEAEKETDVVVEKGRGRGRGRVRGSGTSASKPRCSLKYSSIKFLEKKNDRWYELRKRELELEEKKFLMEKAEREKKIEIEQKKISMDEKRLQAEMAIFENQQKLMEIAFNVRNSLNDLQ